MSLLAPLLTILALSTLTLSQTTITITPSLPLQQIDGFGVSQAFGRASQFEALSNPARQLGLDYLFSTTTGAGLTIIRNRIGSGGAGDSIEPVGPATNISTPTYVWDGVDAGQVWFSQEAMSYGVKTIYADAWSAPGFMKTTGSDSNGGYLCGVQGETCTYDWREAYAAFLLQYVKFYASAGIPITHLGILNEPELVTSYSSMLSNGTQSASFIPTLYAVMQAGGYGNVSLTCCDAEGWADQVTYTAALVVAGMESYLSVITSHMYTSNPTYPISTSLKTWQTEGADLNDAFCTTWYSSGGACEGLTWANHISVGLTAANLSAYLYWEGLEPNATTSSSHLIDTDGTNVTPSGRLWAFAMFSRYIRPGAYRLTSSGTISGATYIAVKNTDGTISVVFTNTGSASESINIAFSGFAATSASAVLTDNSNTLNSTTATVSGGSVAVTLTPYSVLAVKILGNVVAVSSSTSSSTSSTSSVKVSTSTGTSKVSTRSTSTTSAASSTCTALTPLYGQCGGYPGQFSGCTTCVAPYVCHFWSVYYSQCLTS